MRLRIFGAEIEGEMEYTVEQNAIAALIRSPGMEHLSFAFTVTGSDGKAALTQVVEIDTGSRLKNLFIRIFLSGSIRGHLEEEIRRILD